MDPSLPSVPVLGTDCFVGDLDSAATAILTRAESGKGGYACLANVHVIVTARHEATAREALLSAWAVFPDGAPIAWLQRRAGSSQAQRIAGPDLMAAVLERGQSASVRHFLFGSTPQVLEALTNNLAAKYPAVQIVGGHAPAPATERSPNALGVIVDARPDIVWVALGAPKQELWAAQHASALAPALIIGVGAAFDFHAGAKARAPAWMQRSGLEWAHRLGQEPRRLGWRYLSTNSDFVRLILQGERHRT
jgi:N-acetylglucosaminyldiphosphoundecaprenol N-acetyl-beta-D-mannosaminyltransferase